MVAGPIRFRHQVGDAHWVNPPKAVGEVDEVHRLDLREARCDVGVRQLLVAVDEAEVVLVVRHEGEPLPGT